MTTCQRSAVARGHTSSVLGRRRLYSFSSPALQALRGSRELAALPDMKGLGRLASREDAEVLRQAGNAPIQVGRCACRFAGCCLQDSHCGVLRFRTSVLRSLGTVVVRPAMSSACSLGVGPDDQKMVWRLAHWCSHHFRSSTSSLSACAACILATTSVISAAIVMNRLTSCCCCLPACMLAHSLFAGHQC